jgi:hypothetical protein
MTPEEKAQGLVSKFKEVEIYLSIEPTDIDLKIKYITSSSYTAKQCALIAVNELLNDCDATSPFQELRIKYWQEVKNEIEKL